MAAFTATNVTLTVERKWISGPTRHARVKIAFGDAALTYATSSQGGIPLPTFGNWGMKRNLDYIILYDTNDASGFHWKANSTGNALRGYRQGVVETTTGISTVLLSTGGYIELFGAEGTANGLRVAMVGTGTALGVGGTGRTYDTGPLLEMTTTYAVPAQTLYAEAVGW